MRLQLCRRIAQGTQNASGAQKQSRRQILCKIPGKPQKIQRTTEACKGYKNPFEKNAPEFPRQIEKIECDFNPFLQNNLPTRAKSRAEKRKYFCSGAERKLSRLNQKVCAQREGRFCIFTLARCAIFTPRAKRKFRAQKPGERPGKRRANPICT